MLSVDSMIVTKYQVYLGKYNYFTGYPNRPSKMKNFIKGYEKADSVSLRDIQSKIEVQISDQNYLTDSCTFALVKPK